MEITYQTAVKLQDLMKTRSDASIKDIAKMLRWAPVQVALARNYATRYYGLQFPSRNIS